MHLSVRRSLSIAAIVGTAAACRAPAPPPAAAAAAAPKTQPTPFYWANQVFPCPSPEADEAQPVYDATDVATPVTVAIAVGPSYPPALRDDGVTGEVLLSFVVNTAGCAESGSVRVVKDAAPAFVSAAREALVRTRFRPAQREGRLVRQRVFLPYTFEIRR